MAGDTGATLGGRFWSVVGMPEAEEAELVAERMPSSPMSSTKAAVCAAHEVADASGVAA